jgi:predicted PurR-regulated permease PerM
MKTNLEKSIGWILLALLTVGCLLVIKPFISSLLWATVLSFSLWPIYQRLVTRLHGRNTLAAAILTSAMFLSVLLPFAVAGITLAENVEELKAATHRWLGEGLPNPPSWVEKIPLVGQTAAASWKELQGDTPKLLEKARQIIEPATSFLLKGGLKLASGLLDLTLSILISFFLLRHGLKVADRLTSIIGRVAGERGKHLLLVAGSTVRGVVYGILGTALIQALMAGFGFAIAGVPGAAALALLTFFLSVVPMGPPLVWIPATLWLFHQDQTGWGIFMLVWGLGVSSIDNIVKPWLISQGSAMPLLLIFIGVLGGAFAFGFVGVFLGPTLLAVGYRIVAEWDASDPKKALN